MCRSVADTHSLRLIRCQDQRQVTAVRAPAIISFSTATSSFIVVIRIVSEILFGIWWSAADGAGPRHWNWSVEDLC